MEILLMLGTALGCAFIGWALIYFFVSESPTALNTGRRPFAASALAAAPESFAARRKRRHAWRWITTRVFGRHRLARPHGAIKAPLLS